MVLVRETVAGDWQALRDIRLEALRDAPAAFGSTYEREAPRGEADWRNWISRGGTFLGYLPDLKTPDLKTPDLKTPDLKTPEPSGLIGGYQENPLTVELVSMYVRPRARGRGVGEALVATVVSWAGKRNATTVHLWVTETNAPARALYERCGFALTGEQQPLPSDPSLGEVAMSRTLP
jgi:GNAT superfamily N-acetyltransferase